MKTQRLSCLFFVKSEEYCSKMIQVIETVLNKFDFFLQLPVINLDI